MTKDKTEQGKKLADRCFNIIDSVKGGSGKTSLSLFLSLAAQEYMQKQEENQTQKRVHSLLLDMDMQGSALEHLLFGDSEGETGKAEKSLNQAILQYYDSKRRQFISEPKFRINPLGMDGGSVLNDSGANQYEEFKFAAALASTDMEEKMRFRAVSRLNYSPQITYGAFLSGLKNILRDTQLNSSFPDPFHYVFFDMPPNSDGYSDTVLELLLAEDSVIHKKYPRNYFELMTLDRGHIQTTLDWFKYFSKEESYRFPNHFFFVFNNVPPAISPMEFSGLAREQINFIISKNVFQDIPEDQRKRIYFVGITYQHEYLQTCCTGNAIAAQNSTDPRSRLSSNILSPAAFVVDFNGEHLNQNPSEPTKELLKLMRQEEP